MKRLLAKLLRATLCRWGWHPLATLKWERIRRSSAKRLRLHCQHCGSVWYSAIAFDLGTWEVKP